MPDGFDRARFLKVLALAESDMDGEALAAIRKATAMARTAGLSLGEAVGSGATSYDTEFQRGQVVRLETRLKKAERERESLAARVEALQEELEDYRDPLDWQDLADRFHVYHRRKRTSFHVDYAKGVAYRASINKLTVKDRINLREFASIKRRRAA
jgi:hypothetical protein